MSDLGEQVGGLYSRIGPKVAALVSARLRVPADDAYECVHDVFVRILGNVELQLTLTSLDDKAAVRYLLLASIRRYLEQRRRRILVQLESFHEVLALDPQTRAVLKLTELLDTVTHVIGTLDEPYRPVLHKLLIEQKTAREIGRDLDRSTNTIYQQIHRGLPMLRERLRAALLK
jgi:RNA polymerase sigma factor (sigma-70 family)